MFTYKEALEKYKMVGKKFSGAIDDLVAKGFLEITYQGTGPGDPSRYKLIESWKNYSDKDIFKPAPARRINESKTLGWYIYNARKSKN